MTIWSAMMNLFGLLKSTNIEHRVNFDHSQPGV
jgi:hypothetical protein